MALGIALLVIAFLLGRGTQTSAPPLVVVVTPSPSAPVVPSALPPVAGEPAATAPPVEPPADAPRFVSEPTPAPATVAPPATDDARAEVARYFAELDTIQQQESRGGDPQGVAQELLKQAVSGKTEGFDELVASNQRLLQRLRAVTPPAPCAAHHKSTIELVEKAGSMLDKTRSAITTGDVSGLGALTSEGQALERRSREVDAQAGEIKKQYGL